LKQRITEQKKKGKYFQQNQILDWLCQICLAIKHIHDRKILHRDLKSQNVFLTSSNIIKLGDFGVAKCLDYTLQKAETYIGTPYYLSPEIIRGETYSFKSDIWSIGILLYEMITLKMPFEGESIGDLNRKIEKGNYKSIPADYDQNMRKLLTLMLSVEESKRPTIHEILSKYNSYSRTSFHSTKNQILPFGS
jgi:NIMA (never in mitosis gene a)-related kinase